MDDPPTAGDYLGRSPRERRLRRDLARTPVTMNRLQGKCRLSTMQGPPVTMNGLHQEVAIAMNRLPPKWLSTMKRLQTPIRD
jgi:hypothetical protein